MMAKVKCLMGFIDHYLVLCAFEDLTQNKRKVKRFYDLLVKIVLCELGDQQLHIGEKVNRFTHLNEILKVQSERLLRVFHKVDFLF